MCEHALRSLRPAWETQHKACLQNKHRKWTAAHRDMQFVQRRKDPVVFTSLPQRSRSRTNEGNKDSKGLKSGRPNQLKGGGAHEAPPLGERYGQLKVAGRKSPFPPGVWASPLMVWSCNPPKTPTGLNELLLFDFFFLKEENMKFGEDRWRGKWIWSKNFVCTCEILKELIYKIQLKNKKLSKQKQFLKRKKLQVLYKMLLKDIKGKVN